MAVTTAGLTAPLVRYVLGSVGVGCLLLAFWMVVVERRLFRIRRVLLDADEVGLPEMKILHMTDTHFHGRDEAILGFLRRLAEREEFDLLFLTGDLIDSPEGVRSAAETASLFRPCVGSFAVLGGHDYARPGTVATYRHLLRKRPLEAMRVKNPVDDLRRALGDAGVCVLEDSHAVLDGRDGRSRAFAVVGLQDAFQLVPDLDAAWRGLPAGVPVIAIAHSPDVVSDVASRGARLAFFGHTHGGQVRFPLVGALVTRSRLPGRLAAGVFRHGGMVFALNNGLGTSPATPYRLLCRPEVTVLELRRNAAQRELTAVEDARLDRQ